jgi:peptidoglycan biosynthesis protein MviN/MurJ (putative lipid II flippase)
VFSTGLIFAGIAAALTAAVLLALGGPLAAAHLYLPVAFAIGGISSVVAGYIRLRHRRERQQELSNRPSLQHYLLVLLAVAIGVFIGFVVWSRFYPDIGFWSGVLIGAVVFGLAALFFAWQLLFRAGRSL